MLSQGGGGFNGSASEEGKLELGAPAVAGCLAWGRWDQPVCGLGKESLATQNDGGHGGRVL